MNLMVRAVSAHNFSLFSGTLNIQKCGHELGDDFGAAAVVVITLAATLKFPQYLPCWALPISSYPFSLQCGLQDTAREANRVQTTYLCSENQDVESGSQSSEYVLLHLCPMLREYMCRVCS